MTFAARMWQRYEGPTWCVALAIYASWTALVLLHARLPWWLIAAIGAPLVAWHGSLQHETIHALRRVPRRLRTLVAAPPLGVFFPYAVYRRSHLRHHRNDQLTLPQIDPESFYHAPERWRTYPLALRLAYGANQTLIGRLTIGAALHVGAGIVHGVRALLDGDARARRDALVHAALLAALAFFVTGVARMPWWEYLALVAYPGTSLGMLRSFSEHRWAPQPGQRTAIVENRFPFGLLFLNNNYHAVHHDDPTLPWYRIPAVWRARRSEFLSRSGSFHFSGYRTIAQRWLLRPVFDPIAISDLPRTGTSSHRKDDPMTTIAR